MVLNNWYHYFKSMRANQVISKVLKNQYGTLYDSGYATNGGDAITLRSISYNAYQNGNSILLGSGTTPPTVNDYCLEALISSGLSVTVTTSLNADNDMVATLTISNGNSDNITIGEVGYQAHLYTGANSGTNVFLLDRTVLDEPLTIEAGGFGQVTYTIRMNYPTA